jgi:hypothetical protein
VKCDAVCKQERLRNSALTAGKQLKRMAPLPAETTPSGGRVIFGPLHRLIILGDRGLHTAPSTVWSPHAEDIKRKALPRAPEKSLPFAIRGLEGPVESIPGELSLERLKAYGRPKCAVCTDGPVDVRGVALESCLAYHDVAFDGEPNNCWLASVTD